MKKLFIPLLISFPLYSFGAGKCLKEIMANCPKISERSACLSEKKASFSSECSSLVQGMIDFQAGPPVEKPKPEEPVKTKVVVELNDEEKLFNSCIKTGKGQADAEAACRCLSKKWAAGSISSPEKTTETLKIKKEYIDLLISDWNYPKKIKIKDGDQLKGDEAEIFAITTNIAVNCMKESSPSK